MSELRWEPLPNGRRGEFADAPGIGRFKIERIRYAREASGAWSARVHWSSGVEQGRSYMTKDGAKQQCEEWLAAREESKP